DGYLFFFQAEDGIRDWSVTGVQTCALPILADARCLTSWETRATRSRLNSSRSTAWTCLPFTKAACSTSRTWAGSRDTSRHWRIEIGRASCRERVEIWGGAESLEDKRGRVQK